MTDRHAFKIHTHYWAECSRSSAATDGENIEELVYNLHDVVELIEDKEHTDVEYEIEWKEVKIPIYINVKLKEK